MKKDNERGLITLILAVIGAIVVIFFLIALIGDGEAGAHHGGPGDHDGPNGGTTLVGTPGDDDLRGGNGSDTIRALAGDDRLGGEHGGDTLVGGPGDDRFWPGRGKDLVRCGRGFDVVNTLKESPADTYEDCEVVK